VANRRNRYKDFDRLMTIVLIGDGVLFLAFLIFSGLGVTWGKWLSALICLGISGASLAYLYLSKEWLKRRSFWMTVASGAVVLCTLVSLICNYPSPNKLKQNEQPKDPASQGDDSQQSGGESASFSDYFVI